jgi:GNAT superfamily N-acetyltransferase
VIPLEDVLIEPATIEDVSPLADLLIELFTQERDFTPDREKQVRGLRLIIESPNRGRVFVARHNGKIIGMINLLITISTAEGGFVLLLEDLIIAGPYRVMGVGTKLMEHALHFAREKRFMRITLLTDEEHDHANAFYEKHGFKRSNMIPMRLNLAVDLGETSGFPQ